MRLLTQLQPVEAENLDGFQPLRLGRGGQQLVNRQLVVFDVNLVYEAILFVVLLDPVSNRPLIHRSFVPGQMTSTPPTLSSY